MSEQISLADGNNEDLALVEDVGNNQAGTCNCGAQKKKKKLGELLICIK